MQALIEENPEQKSNILDGKTLLNAAWECITLKALVNCIALVKKVGINSKSQSQSQSDDEKSFKLLSAGRFESPNDVLVDDY